MEEEEEAIGYLDKVLEDEDDSEPGTPTSPGSPFSANEKVGGRDTPLPRGAVGRVAKGHLAGAGDAQVSGQLLEWCGGCWVGGGGGRAGGGQQEHPCSLTTSPGQPAAGSVGQGCVRSCAESSAQSGMSTHPSPRGERGPRVLLWWGSVAQPSPRWMLRKGLDHTPPLPHHTATSNPRVAPGGPLCWQA